MSRLRRAVLVALAVSAMPAVSTAQAPSPGRAVLAKMESAYRGKWYTTLTFVQKTTFYVPGAAERVQTWWESLRYTPAHGVQLRIDRGDLTSGNGSMQTADSTWIFRAGALAQTRSGGNEFLPLIEGVYVQPLDVTESQVRAMGIDMNRVHRREHKGRPTIVVGAYAGDDTTTQFWIDDERQVVTRMIIRQGTGQLLDIVLDGYERTGGGWLGTKVDILVNGQLRQREEYADWKVDVPLPDALFDPAQWSAAPHWGRR